MENEAEAKEFRSRLGKQSNTIRLLIEALDEYGKHHYQCPAEEVGNVNSTCDCGLDDIKSLFGD